MGTSDSRKAALQRCQGSHAAAAVAWLACAPARRWLPPCAGVTTSASAGINCQPQGPHSLTRPLPAAALQVIGNTGSNSTGEALHATEQGFAVGMHAALQINPYYGKTSKAGLVAHFDAVLKEGPAVIYNVPGRTGQDIPDDIVHHMAGHPNFLGMKECTGNERIGNYTKQVGAWVGR